MRSYYLLLSFFCILALTACGTEEELAPPAFSNIKVNGAADTSLPFKDASVTITGKIDDFAGTIVATSTVSGEVPVPVNSSDGSWNFLLTPLTVGANSVSFTASDERGNINQMILTVLYEPIPRVVSVTQNVDSPQLIVTFDEALLESSVATVFFSVVTAADGSAVVDSLTGALTQSTVTLSLPEALPSGTYRLICPAVTDLDGNGLVTNSFDFTIE